MNFLRFRSVFLVIGIVLLLGSSCSSAGGGCSAPWASSGDRLLGSPAPNFILPNLAGEKVELAGLVNQKPTLLVFWATWCPSCVEEVPILNRWSEKYSGLQILGVNVEEPAARVRAFRDRQKIRYPVLLDEKGDVAHQYGLVGIPATILLAKGGRVIYYGFALPRNIEQLIKE